MVSIYPGVIPVESYVITNLSPQKFMRRKVSPNLIRS